MCHVQKFSLMFMNRAKFAKLKTCENLALRVCVSQNIEGDHGFATIVHFKNCECSAVQ